MTKETMNMAQTREIAFNKPFSLSKLARILKASFIDGSLVANPEQCGIFQEWLPFQLSKPTIEPSVGLNIFCNVIKVGER